MAFNLKKVLKALLFSTSQPLAIKDIQAAFTRFHDQAALATETEEADAPAIPAVAAVVAEESSTSADLATGAPAVPEGAPAADDATVAQPAPTVEPAEVIADTPTIDPADAELYQEVPSLITATQIREAMDLISAELKAADEGLLLVESPNGYRLVTHPRFARWIRILRAEPPPVKLSQSSIETLAIIAYRQPVTRGEIETIRGVSAEAGVNKLLERELIYVVGRADLPGRPIQYGTTDKFLEFVGVKSLDELPASDVLSSRQVDDWLKKSTSPVSPTDTDMGLSDEQLPLGPEARPAVTAEPAPSAEARAPSAEAEPQPEKIEPPSAPASTESQGNPPSA